MSAPAIPKSRLEALTDGIFAVTMTLLVLDLRRPEPGAQTLLADLAQLADRLDNWVISFVVLGVFWLGHVRMLGRMRAANAPFAAGNLAFLLFTTLLPPLTTWSASTPKCRRRRCSTAPIPLRILACEMLLWRRVCRRLANETLGAPESAWRIVRRRFLLSIGVVVAGIATALVEIRIGASQGLATWIYLLLIGMGLVRPPTRRRDR